MPTQIENQNAMFHIFPCILEPKFLRSEVRKKLKERGVESGVHYLPNHLHSLYSVSYTLPNSESVGSRLLSLPFHANMTISDVEFVCQELKSVLEVLH
jgi:dTDP-4-amino-4,6-dideoxygalactose transaminase